MIEFRKSGRLTKIRFEPTSEPVMAFRELFPFALAVWKRAAAAGAECAKFKPVYLVAYPVKVPAVRAMVWGSDVSAMADISLENFRATGPELSAEWFAPEVERVFRQVKP